MQKDDNTVFVYANSYYGIFVGLYMKSLGYKVILLTYTDNIKKACNALELNYISIAFFTNKDFIFNSKAVSKEIKRLTDVVGKKQFHFSHRQFDILCFLLTDRLKTRSNVYFHPIENLFLDSFSKMKRLIKKRFYIHLIIKLFINIKWNLKLKIIVYPNMVLLGLNNAFFNSGINKINYNQSFGSLKKQLIIQNQIKSEPCVNLFVTQPYKTIGAISGTSVYNLISEINNCGIDITFKYHPRDSNRANKREFYPSYLPVELLYTNVKNSVISVYSTSLIHACEHSHIIAISILDMIKWNDQSYREEMRAFLKKESNNNIYFPTSLEELKDLLEY